MKDRIPKYPGRVQLIPVSGKVNTYDMARADEAEQEGTPINARTLVTEETAARFGLSPENATPENAFQMIAAALAAGLKVELGTYAGTLSGSTAGGESSPTTIHFDNKPLFVLVRSTQTASSVSTSVPSRGVWLFAWRVEDPNRTKWENLIVYSTETSGFYLLYKPSDGEVGIDFGENSISFYSTKTPYTSIYQFNSNYCSYSYFAVTV